MITVSSNFNLSETQPENSNEWNYFFPPNIITHFDEKETKTSKQRANRNVFLNFDYVFGNLRIGIPHFLGNHVTYTNSLYYYLFWSISVI